MIKAAVWRHVGDPDDDRYSGALPFTARYLLS